MNKKVLISIIVILILAVIAAGAFYFLSGKKDNTNKNNTLQDDSKPKAGITAFEPGKKIDNIANIQMYAIDNGKTVGSALLTDSGNIDDVQEIIESLKYTKLTKSLGIAPDYVVTIITKDNKTAAYVFKGTTVVVNGVNYSVDKNVGDKLKKFIKFEVDKANA